MSLIRGGRYLINKFKWNSRNMANAEATRHEKSFLETLRRIAFNTSGYNRYGLYSDDVINENMPMVKTALSRLPADIRDARSYRIIRAMHLDTFKIFLPEEKWITYEQDRAYRYLRPYLEEAIAEKEEMHNFGCVNYEQE
ncbi:cytochrome b-c1 complex subunit 7-like [Cephus cinctus]|uniref:Cytochrome b-c1 complex subunit 7 n=1 Tax=Cephus cinctus TaxID=211228 RepID=A0AAJ7C7S4_CEPCN|nr:cytochrome b-c1 complex subunit 7-like [Cephus cinctus]